MQGLVASRRCDTHNDEGAILFEAARETKARRSQREERRDAIEARAPDTPVRLGASAWGGVLRRTFTEYREDNLGNLAAALTYYGILAIFPALIALVSILGLVGHSATQPLIENLGKVAPGPAMSKRVGPSGRSFRRVWASP